jgi:hypothetical protein
MTLTGGRRAGRPPFYAYLETIWNREWALELLDSRFAADYRRLYGDTVYHPDDFVPDDDHEAHGRAGPDEGGGPGPGGADRGRAGRA